MKTISGIVAAVALSAGLLGAAEAAVKIALTADMSGPQALMSGQGSAEAAKMAIEDFGGKVLGGPIEFISGDNQMKADLSVSLARRWIEDENADAIVGINLSPAALQIASLAERYNRVALISDAGATSIVQQHCSPNHVLWGWNGYAYANITMTALVKAGKKTFFFITPDLSYGHETQQIATTLLEKQGGKAVGTALHPVGNTDYSSHLLRAKASGADVVVLLNFSNDALATIKQAKEFGISEKQIIAPLTLVLQDIDTLGRDVAQGLYVPVSFSWNRDDETRAWSARFEKRVGRAPNFIQAQVYSSTLNYLRAVEKAGTKDGRSVVAALKSMKIDDMFAKRAYLRADGQLIHDMYLVRIKKPAEMKGRWDYEQIVATESGDAVYQPMDTATCKLLKK